MQFLVVEGNTLGLVLLMCFSQVKHLKTIGRLSVIPGICGINEPVIFGAPIVLNPILAIPFVFMPCISIGLGYLAQSIGLVSMGYIVDPSFTPFFCTRILISIRFKKCYLYVCIDCYKYGCVLSIL